MILLDEKGFVFLDANNKPFWVALYRGQPWLFWWHPDRRWVTLRQVSQEEIRGFPQNLSAEQQAVYHRQNDQEAKTSEASPTVDELAAEAKRWEGGELNPKDWVDAPEAVPNAHKGIHKPPSIAWPRCQECRLSSPFTSATLYRLVTNARQWRLNVTSILVTRSIVKEMFGWPELHDVMLDQLLNRQPLTIWSIPLLLCEGTRREVWVLTKEVGVAAHALVEGE